MVTGAKKIVILLAGILVATMHAPGFTLAQEDPAEAIARESGGEVPKFTLKSLYSEGKVSKLIGKAKGEKTPEGEKEEKKDDKKDGEKAKESAKQQEAVVPEEVENKVKPIDYLDLPYKGSLMYDSRSVQALYAYLNGNKASFNVSTNSVMSFDVLPTTAPAFYLNMLSYISSENWSVWLNNKKFEINAGGETIDLHRVEKDFVIFRWKPKKLDYIAPNWQAGFFAADAEKNKLVENRQGLMSKDGNIFVDAVNNEVYFRLSVNQSFVSRTMEIAEGYKGDFVIPTQDSTSYSDVVDIKQGQ